MHRTRMYNMLILLCVLHIVIKCPTFCSANKAEDKILRVGEEMWRETLPLQGGSRLYQLKDLKPHLWYEVKISYPASVCISETPFITWIEDIISSSCLWRILVLDSDVRVLKHQIPASISVQLKRDKLDMALNNNRRLLNTEKIIFKTESDQDEMYVLVNVEPEGFVAIPHVAERQFIIYNIVCDELLFGIPHKAWWVVFLALLCLGIAFMIPCFLPSYLLQKNQSSRDRKGAKRWLLVSLIPSHI